MSENIEQTTTEDVGSEEENVSEVPEAPTPKRYKVKVDQEEMEVDEEELLKGYQLSKASNKRFQEASEIQKQVERLIEDSRKDPRKMFEVLGLNPREWSEQLLLQELEESMLTPDDKKRRDESAELESYRKEKLSTKQKQEEAEKASYFDKASQEIDDEISQVLQDSGLKPTARNIARMAEYMLAGIDSENRLTAKDAYNKVRHDYDQDIVDLLQTTPMDKLVDMLPKSFLSDLRKYEVSKHATQAKLPSFNTPGSKPQAMKEEKPRKKSIDELLG